MVKGGYLVDTNVLSELRKGSKADPAVLSWASHVKRTELWVSVICLMEIRNGIHSVLHKDAAFGHLLQSWYEEKLKPSFSGRILTVGLKEAECCADLQRIRTLPFRDGFIAATAASAKLTLVTRNTKDFEGLMIPYLNPWT